MLTSADIRAAIDCMHATIGPVRDALNAADRILGDGDTGMTIEQIVIAWHAAAPTLPEDLGTALSALGKATMQASGSSLGAVISTGLSAAGRSMRTEQKTQLDDLELTRLLQAAIDRISERGGANAGDKSMLDSLFAIRDALQVESNAGGATLQRALGAAHEALDAFRDRQSRLGRARVQGERSIGQDDPGMLAIYLLLQTLANQPAR